MTVKMLQSEQQLPHQCLDLGLWSKDSAHKVSMIHALSAVAHLEERLPDGFEKRFDIVLEVLHDHKHGLLLAHDNLAHKHNVLVVSLGTCMLAQS